MTGQRRLVDQLVARDALKPDVPEPVAADIVYALMSPTSITC